MEWDTTFANQLHEWHLSQQRNRSSAPQLALEGWQPFKLFGAYGLGLIVPLKKMNMALGILQ